MLGHYGLVTRLLPAFRCCMRKKRKPSKTYHTNNIAGGTDIFDQVEPSHVSSTCYVIHVISFTRLPCLSHATLKSREEPGYEAKAVTSAISSLRKSQAVLHLRVRSGGGGEKSSKQHAPPPQEIINFVQS